jgi:hypothetical protein
MNIFKLLNKLGPLKVRTQKPYQTAGIRPGLCSVVRCEPKSLRGHGLQVGPAGVFAPTTRVGSAVGTAVKKVVQGWAWEGLFALANDGWRVLSRVMRIAWRSMRYNCVRVCTSLRSYFAFLPNDTLQMCVPAKHELSSALRKKSACSRKDSAREDKCLLLLRRPPHSPAHPNRRDWQPPVPCLLF